MTLSFAVVCEAPADQRTGCGLADRVFCAEVDWAEEETLDHLRRWWGFADGESCLLWKHVKQLAAARNVRMHGHFEGEPGALDAAATRRALAVLRLAEPPVDAIVLLRDDDRLAERRVGMEQARKDYAKDHAVPVVIGLAHVVRECWVLAGFLPRDEAEHACLAELRRELGFNPCERSEELTAKHEQDRRSAKRVLGRLTGGSIDREAVCWCEGDLDRINKRGKGCGLTAYLEEVRERLVPLFNSPSA